MKKLKYALLLVGIAAAVVGSVLTSVYTLTLSEQLDDLRQSCRADTAYLRRQIQLLEDDFQLTLAEKLAGLTPPDCSVNGTPDEVFGNDQTDLTEPESDSAQDTEIEESESETVTLPTHDSPETEPSIPDDETIGNVTNTPNVSEQPEELYLISTHNGRIGIFAADGQLMKTVNVFVLTLPQADRNALEVGIAAYSWEDALQVAERYE